MITKISDDIYEETKEIKLKIDVKQLNQQIAYAQANLDKLKAKKAEILAIKDL